MTPIRYCFLDMDGVLTDFVKAACTVHNRPDPYLDSSNYGIFDMDRIWNITAREFWKPTEVTGFWESMDKQPFADELVETLCATFGLKNIAILTSPSLAANCIPEKRQWIERYYPQFSGQIIFTGAKQFLAHPNTLLIDDRDANVKQFQAYNGKAIICPQPWNSQHADVNKRMDVIRETYWWVLESWRN